MFRFTIRDVMWLTMVVALVAGWSLDHAVQRGRRAGSNHIAESYYNLIRHLRTVLDEKAPGWEVSDPPPGIPEPDHTR